MEKCLGMLLKGSLETLKPQVIIIRDTMVMVITGISTTQNTTLRLRTPNFLTDASSLSVCYRKSPWFKSER